MLCRQRTLGLLAVVLVLGPSLLGGVPGAALAQAGARALNARADRGKGSARATHPEANAPAQVTLTQGAGTPGVQITMPPVGLSIEYPVMALDLGAGACPPPALIAALQQLGSPPLSLAGDSQDMTVPSDALSGAASSWETATLFPLPTSFWAQLHCLLSAAHDPLTVGLNLKTGQPSWAQQMVAGAQSAATDGLDFSLGNEPDLYPLPNYASLGKPQPNEQATQVALYVQLASALQQTLAGAPTIGPELAGAEHWQRELPHVIAQLHLATVGVHAYPLTACVTPKAVTVGGLLTAYAADEPRKFAWVVADAQAAGVPAIISEANSASCGGVEGVSDSPASAVWAVRFVLSALKTGFHEVRFHFSGDPYDPFVVRGEEVIRRPLDSALVALNQWLPVGSSLRTVAGVRGLLASNVTSATGASLLILENERAHAQKLVLRGAQSVNMESLSAARGGVVKTQLSAVRGRIKLLVAGNSVVALSAAG
ncbi:MAG TPA: hypothetical protein VMF09_00505 [Solirubrobacteraceae bacterium]|nr:hypothetical protein [Solirubrobacteraceae bacterium]